MSERVLTTIDVTRPTYGGDLLPERFCNLDRLIDVMEHRDVDVVVAHLKANVFYLSGFSSRATQSIGEGHNIATVIFSRHVPEDTILVVPDWDLEYVNSHRTWIKDVRAYATLMVPSDVAPDAAAFDRFVRSDISAVGWGRRAREMYAPDFLSACRQACNDIGALRPGVTVAVDDPRYGSSLGLDQAKVVDGYGFMRFVRQVKTPEELDLLKASADVNAAAIQRSIDAYVPGMTWHELQHIYHVNAVALGGFVHDPGAINVANPPNPEDAGTFPMAGDKEDFEVQPGTSMMWDCHGTLAHYCWDGGKTWVVGDERTGTARKIQEASIEAMEVVRSNLKPGNHTKDLERDARAVFRAHGVPDADRALVFFHGLGLDHIDIERTTALGLDDWRLETASVVSTHVVYPGTPQERFYLEDNAVVSPEGGRSLYDWDMTPFLRG